MPYIEQKERVQLLDRDPRDVGELAYELAEDVEIYLTTRKGGIRFTDLAHVVGALDLVKLEFYHRIVAPYEKNKMRENGDVWGGTIKKLGLSEV